MKALLYPLNMKYKYDLDTLEYPISAYVKVTSSCMLSCSFCSQGKEMKCTLSLELAKKILLDLKEMGIIQVTYTGGEPLLNNKILDIVKFGYDLGFKQTLVTNLLDIYKRNNEQILNYITNIGVSLHGLPDTHDQIVNRKGAFNIVANNIDRILNENKKINININYTMFDRNINDEDMNFILKFAKKRNIKLCFGRLNYIGNAENFSIMKADLFLEKIDNLLKKYNNIEISNCIAKCVSNKRYKYLNHSCGVGISIISIEPNGDVKICPSSSITIGNVKTNSLKKIWKSKKIKDFKKMNWLPNICRICKDLSSCKGGCHAEGTHEFWKNCCDEMLLLKFKLTWEKIENKKIILRTNVIRKEGKYYTIINFPARKTNKYGFEIIKSIDGKTTSKDLITKFNKIENAKDFLIALYLDNIIQI